MKTWHPPIVDFLRRHLPSDSFIRPYAKRIVEDARSVLHSGQDWTVREQAAPENLFLETTNICNADCVFCAYQYQDRFRAGKGVMSDETFEKALADYVAFTSGPAERHVNFTPLVGDPLVDPKIIHRVARCKAIGADVTFFTNGILLNRIDVKALVATEVDRIYISTAPFEREAHERLYRTHGKYDDLLAGVQKLLDARNEQNATTRVNLMFRSDIPLPQIKELPDFKRCILPRLRPKEVNNIYAQVRGFDSWGGQIQQSDLPPGMGLAQPPRLKRRPCLWTFNLMVMYDGLVRACSCRFTGSERVGTDGLLVGNLKEQTLAEIWKGDAIRALHRTFEAGNLREVCRSCTMYRSV
ncbi:MAG TPA: radical SAM protein [Candidatus Binatia bacterium]|jgi:MoaA/NifB/PqqE/SkfB family radical SAM enzyme|nr:radical SAM protein [Candidatus Binatia bacterium]